MATLVAFMSAHYISTGWPTTQERHDDIVKGPLCPLAGIRDRLSDRAARVRTIDTEVEPCRHLSHN